MRAHFVPFLLALALVVSADPLPRRGTVGVAMRALPDALQKELKLGPQEAVQASATANGLKEGDVVVAVSGHAFKSFGEYSQLIREASAGASVKLTVIRDGKKSDLGVKFLPKSADDGDTYTTVYDHVVSNGHRIRTFVTKPKTPGKHPVLFWIQGINASTVEARLDSGNYITSVLKPFADDGWVTVRVEKPGVGDSEGGPALLVGFDEEVDIYRQALKDLAKYDFVDRDQVVVFGHSMGGCHAPIIASEHKVKAIISYGTVSDSWLEWQVKSARIQGPLGGQSRADIDREVRKTIGVYHYLYNEKRSIEWIKQNHPELQPVIDQTSTDGVMLGNRSIKYMQEVNDRNFCDYWAKTGEARVLALFGEADWISLREDQTQVAEVVNGVHPGYATFKVVPQSNHIFQKALDFKDDFPKFGKPGAVFNPAIVQVMKDWIKGLSG
ncbi:MAG: alpha/beta fold hydrolase [Armatimonadetes bacterium]|nr:alpha/beta fold hydrolase [Armatimonadota bacterium]